VDQVSSPVFASIGGSDPERTESAWYFEKVPELKSAKNRMHVTWSTRILRLSSDL